MNNFGRFVTPEDYVAMCADGVEHDLAALQRMATAPPRRCENCREEAWRLAGVGLCFTCVTGEASAADDCELVPSNPARSKA